ncbi:MAG: hypothetical protein P1V20_03240 [Verrucomicrobiales bacterium]|nr:hypothetical protein [Verrucomicrobiales bacterium]
MKTRFIKNATVTGVPFGILAGIAFGLQDGMSAGILSGIVCGLLFGICIAGFNWRQRRKMAGSRRESGEEEILLQGVANHFCHGEGRGGWLTLTKGKLSFRSHGKNLQNQPVDIDLSEISEALPVRTAGIIPNGLEVVLQNDSGTERFVVCGRKEWLRKISEQLRETK